MQLTLDQVLFMLCDKDMLRNSVGDRTAKRSIGDRFKERNGEIVGRDRHGKPIKAAIKGKSRARQLMEQAEKERAAQRKKKQRRRE